MSFHACSCIFSATYHVCKYECCELLQHCTWGPLPPAPAQIHAWICKCSPVHVRHTYGLLLVVASSSCSSCTISAGSCSISGSDPTVCGRRSAVRKAAQASSIGRMIEGKYASSTRAPHTQPLSTGSSQRCSTLSGC